MKKKHDRINDTPSRHLSMSGCVNVDGPLGLQCGVSDHYHETFCNRIVVGQTAQCSCSTRFEVSQMADGFKFELGAVVFFLHDNTVHSSKVYARRRVDAKPAFRAEHSEKQACLAFGDFGQVGTVSKIEYSLLDGNETIVVEEKRLHPNKQLLLESL